MKVKTLRGLRESFYGSCDKLRPCHMTRYYNLWSLEDSLHKLLPSQNKSLLNYFYLS